MSRGACILKAHIDNYMLNILIGKFVSDPGFIHLHFLFLFNHFIFIFWINVMKDHPGFECVVFMTYLRPLTNERVELFRELLFEASLFIHQSIDKNANPLLFFFGVVGVIKLLRPYTYEDLVLLL